MFLLKRKFELENCLRNFFLAYLKGNLTRKLKFSEMIMKLISCCIPFIKNTVFYIKFGVSEMIRLNCYDTPSIEGVL